VIRRKDRSAPDTILPGYQDVTEIGGGAFATVYRATEIDTGRPVALKILKIDAVHLRLMDTFTQEVQALARVSDHPNIVTLYRPVATPDGRPVLVLELCRESLAQQVRRTGPLPARQVTRVGIKIAGALETAHRRGFLHRDMKPQNILVTQFGEPALTDFGVAALQASAQVTAGVFGFTTVHAAPEILEGNQLSPATDVYGLASTLYQLLTGAAPFAAYDDEAPASLILRIIRDPVRPIRAADVPLDLSDLLEAALSKDPEARPGSALEFAESLIALEAASGWIPTAYLAWDQAGPIGQPAVEPAPARPVATSPTRLYGIAPSVQGPRPAAPAHEAEGSTATHLPWGPPPVPPAPVYMGPSVAAPAAAARHVIGPGQPGRGHDSPPIPSPSSPPLLPLHVTREGATLRSARPVFVDPPEASELAPSPVSARGARLETIHEQTMRPDLRGVSAPSGDQSRPNTGPPLPASPLLIGGITAAVIVVIAAVLLIVGIF
jgi:serine/threonine protein kinase